MMRGLLVGLSMGLSLSALAEQLALPKSAVDTDEAPEMVFDGREPATKPLPVYKIAEDTYFLYGNIAEIDEKNRGFNGNAGFVVTPEGVVVMDTLGSPQLGRRLIATVRSVTDRPIRYVIITHNHPDHAYGAVAFKALPGAKIIAHEGALQYLRSDALARSVAYRRQFIAPDMQGFRAVRPDILVKVPEFQPFRFTLGGKKFAVYNVGRHHSYGDLIVHQEDQRILWVSDLVFNNRTTYMGDGHSKQTLAAIEWMRKQFDDVRLMVPGHGSVQSKPFPMVDRTYRYVDRLRTEMGQAVKAGIDLGTAVNKSDFKDWHDTRLYEENHRKNANFVYQEMEQALFFDR